MAVHLPLLLLAAPKGTGHFVPKDQRAPVAYETANGLILFKASVADREAWANLDTAPRAQ